MKREFPPFDDLALKYLKNPKVAASFLNESINYKGKFHKEMLMEAIKQVMKAHGIAKLAKKTKKSRATLYKAFQKNGNPSLDTLLAILDEIGVSMRFEFDKTA